MCLFMIGKIKTPRRTEMNIVIWVIVAITIAISIAAFVASMYVLTKDVVPVVLDVLPVVAEVAFVDASWTSPSWKIDAPHGDALWGLFPGIKSIGIYPWENIFNISPDGSGTWLHCNNQ